MKLMIASDIHGSDTYCEKMLEAFAREGAERLLLLGDILYHGPRNDLPDGYAPKKVIERLNSVKQKLLCVRGNCDTEVDQMVLEFPILADYSLIWLGGRALYATRGHVYNEDKLPPLNSGDILLYGHTHIPKHSENNGVVCINPGSVSIPKNGSCHSYIICDDSDGKLSFVWKQLDGDEYMSLII